MPDGEQMSIYDAAMKYKGGGGSTGRDCRQRVWLGVVARLGSEGNAATGG